MATVTRETVTKVTDGDTFETSAPRRPVRLEGVDTPEPNEPGYETAKAALTRLILHRRVKIHTKAIGAYGRRIAQVWRLSDNLNVNEAMRPYSK